MTKYKVAELEGAPLDAAVAMAEGWTFYRNKRDGITIRRPEGSSDEVGNYPARFDQYSGEPVLPVSAASAMEAAGNFFPSTSWSDGGPVIERERIAVIENGYECTEWDAYVRGFYSTDEGLDGDGFARGPTPLIAAMRAYVASKFGEEVELP
jgi:hypothetical protein